MVTLAEQIRIDLVALARDAGAPLAIDRLDAHQAHERAHVTAADLEALALEHAGEPPRTEERMRKVQLVDAAHERQIGGRNRLRLVVRSSRNALTRR